MAYTLAAVALCLVVQQADAQTATGNFKKGTLILADGSSLPGFIKDNMRKNASVVFSPEPDGKKKTYNGSELSSLEIEGIKFICIKGDFFKVFCEGELSFLQKASDASGKPVYNGNEAVFSNGTEGKPNDYFIYNNSSNQLTLVSKKNVEEVAKTSFAGNTAAIDKAKTINGDVARLKEAVELYNNTGR